MGITTCRLNRPKGRFTENLVFYMTYLTMFFVCLVFYLQEEKQDQHQVSHAWRNRYYLFFIIRRNIVANKNNLKKKITKIVKLWHISRHYLQFLQWFLSFAFNIMHDWWAMNVQLLFHQDFRDTHCQSSAMIFFIVKQYSFWNSFRHGLISIEPGGWHSRTGEIL